MLMIVLASQCFALFEDKKIIINNYIPGLTKPQADLLYCSASNPFNCPSNITNQTNQYNYYNITQNITVYSWGDNIVVAGNVTAQNFFGNIDFSEIVNWNWATVYNNIKAYISGDYYDKGEVDTKISAINTTGGSTVYSGGTEGTVVLVSNSMYQDTLWNVSKSQSEDYAFKVYNNVIITPVGGEIQ